MLEPKPKDDEPIEKPAEKPDPKPAGNEQDKK